MTARKRNEAINDRPLTVERLREVLSYDPETGYFTWVKRLSNNVPGSRAGSDDRRGYLTVRIDKVVYRLHRLAWFYVHGEWPPHDIDHINGMPSDNRLTNLRPATKSQNMWNAKRRADNTSGYKGVCWSTAKKKWEAKISLNGKMKFLGRFDKAEDAHGAYCKAASQHFGEFGRLK